MLRSAFAVLLLTILPSFASAQDPPPTRNATHEVVRGETLWSLAARYLGDPFQWPVIFEANADRIRDPNVLEPGQVLIIPGAAQAPATVENLVVVSGRDSGVRESQPVQPSFDSRQAARPPASRPRTRFYTGTAEQAQSGRRAAMATPEGQVTSEAVRTAAVPPGLVYSAEWLGRFGEEEPHLGVIRGLSQVKALRTPRFPAQVGEEVVIEGLEGAPIQPGDGLQAFRPLRREGDVGWVQGPTGTLVVTGVEGSTATARVGHLFAPIELGDLVRILPGPLPRAGSQPIPIRSDLTATVIGFPRDLKMLGLGTRAFLDVGAEEGVVVGDIFRAYVGEAGSGFGTEAARLQVVLVEGNRSTAMIIDLKRTDLARGDLLRLIAKMET